MMKPILLDNIEKLNNVELIQALIKKHSMEAVPRLRRLQKYYLGQHDILQRTMADESKPNNKIVNSYASYITDMVQGYWLGKPVTYTSTNEALLESVQAIHDANDEQAHNSLIGKDLSIYGSAFELLYLDEQGNLKFAQLPVEETFMIWDTGISPKAIGAIRYYSVMDYLTGDSTMRVEVYTDNTIKHYVQNEDGFVLVEELQHYFGSCPVNFYMNNDEEMGDFEKVMSLIDAYDKAVSDQVNDFEYLADSFMVITGMADTPVEEFKDMKNNRIILLGDNGKAEWLVKQTDNATTESYKTRLQKDIHKFSHTPDLSTDEMGNLSGIAIEYKFMGLEQICSNKERLFKQSLSNRIRMIAQILNIKGNNLDANELKPNFTRNIPVNMDEITKSVKELYGLVSHDTLLAQLPFVTDVGAELEKIQKEKESNRPEYSFPLENEDINPTIEVIE